MTSSEDFQIFKLFVFIDVCKLSASSCDLSDLLKFFLHIVNIYIYYLMLWA